MTPAANTIDSSRSLPTLAAIQRRRRELLAFQAWQRPAPATAPSDESLAAEESYLEEDSCLAEEPEEPDHAEDPEPSPATGPTTPVSYTHLDVYKRQPLLFLPSRIRK